MNSRIEREKRTIERMIGMHCRHFHGLLPGNLCDSCTGLREYALRRTGNCRFREEKPVCTACPVHCYKRDRREQIRRVIQFAGPRMIWKHPMLAMQHLLDKKKSALNLLLFTRTS